MTRLSRPITELKPHYEVIVIGSGYGGGIAASRMARCGRKVCLLEKGKEFLPGEFPSTLAEATTQMQITKEGTHAGNTNGLYEFVAEKEISVFKGCGLGGTSLVNANVSIEPEPAVFNDPRWPDEILSNNKEQLRFGYDRAREMLKPTPYPENKNGYPVLSKTEGMRKSAAALGEPFRLLDINVNFADKINHVGVEQKKCINCGDCVTGCNHQSKNTTAMNYLPDAKNHGAEIFTEAAVSHIERGENEWIVFFQLCHAGREKFEAPLLFVKADKVFLSAGSLGSTELLLRSAQRGLAVSDMLGKGFTGNGDVLGFGYNNDVPIHGIGLGDKAAPPKIDKVGPCITSIIDMRNKKPMEDGMTLEEGSVPGPIHTILKDMLLPLSKIIGKDTDSGFADYLKEKWREIKSLFGGAYTGAIDSTQIYLVMTHDDGKGEISLKNDRVHISWPGVGRETIFQKVNEKLMGAAKALGGIYVKNPVWTKLFGYELVTVHPLGGCVIGKDASSGVVNHKSEVYSGKSGNEVHPGLYIMDGAIVPRPLGTNPLLTISALAERSCKIIAEEANWKLSYDFEKVKLPETKPTTGVQFTETMTGFFSTDEKKDYKKAYDQGALANSAFKFTLTIQCQDVDAFVQDPAHQAGMIGTVTASSLSASPLMVSDGVFNLFVKEGEKTKKMKYEMKLHSIEGKTFFFSGFKEIQDDKGFDLWSDTTTLYITIFQGVDSNGPVSGLGLLKIKISDFEKQLTTMKAVHAQSAMQGLEAIAKFGKLFASNLWDTYFKKNHTLNS